MCALTGNMLALIIRLKCRAQVARRLLCHFHHTKPKLSDQVVVWFTFYKTIVRLDGMQMFAARARNIDTTHTRWGNWDLLTIS